MKIQPINQTIYNSKTNRNSKPNKHAISFKNYEEAIFKALDKDLINRAEVTKTFAELTQELINKPNTKKMPEFSTFQIWLMTKSTYLIEELCKPITKIRPEFRDILFRSKEENIPILKSDNDDELVLTNFGKHGFWNNLFECESANNDIRLIFGSKLGSFELATTKNNEIVADQSYRSGYWQSNRFCPNTGQRIALETGDSNETPVLGLY